MKQPRRIINRLGNTILEETCYHSNSSEKPSANAAVKNSQKNEMIITITRPCQRTKKNGTER